ncbi:MULTISPECIES: hypothetical protein [Pantoea]|uniref:Uncharacterized protein n=2 Tax=Pantoea TaxID=53335 RepID=A0A0U3UPG4_9GAMM|nr:MULTISPECIES: hypothetical protein [Pantoea]ALV91562.1 hypothetical protein LK04_05140 [Pantoea vagans]KHJ65740.1 hypothetical protein QU24_22945 [Pantoea rodasii]
MNGIIKASLSKPLTVKEDKKEKVLYLPGNGSHFNMALIFAETSKYDGYIYANGYDVIARNYIKNNSSSKVKFFLTESSVADFLPIIDKVVVFYGSVTQFSMSNFKRIILACLKTKKPMYEVPHGLFQSGQNLIDNSNLIDTNSYYDGIGENLPSLTNIKLSWSGDDGFGYPRTALMEKYHERVLPKFTLITSNTNWFLYSQSDKRRFYKEIFDYAEKNSDEIFIWCPHPAELMPDTFSFAAMDFKPNNFLLYGLHNDIYFHGIEGTDDLIPYCEYGISTVTTCLLDYEMHSKRVNVFNCSGVENLISEFESASSFYNAEEIKNDAKEIKTGLLKSYDSNKFDSLLSQNVDESSFKNSHYLASFI